MSTQTSQQGHVVTRRQVGLAVSLSVGAAIALLVCSNSSETVLRGRQLQASYDDASYRSNLDPPTSYASQTGAVSVHKLMQLFKSAGFTSPQAGLRAMARDSEPTLEEFQAAEEDMKWGLNRQQAAAVFKGLDADQNGKVKLDEMLGAWQRGSYYFDVTVPDAPEQSPETKTAWQPMDHVYDCEAGAINWKVGWSDEKKNFCSLISAREMRSRLQQGIGGNEVFNLLDREHKGAVSKEEWVYGASSMHGLNAPFQTVLSVPQADYAFKAMDTNKDGVLSHDELVISLGSAMHPTLSGAGQVPQGGTGYYATTSGNSHTTAAELRQRLEAKWNTLSNAFDQMDVDDQHTLDLGKLAKGLKLLSPPITDHTEVAYIFGGLDTIQDGRITPPEFHGTLRIGHFHQTTEAVQKALGLNLPDGAAHSTGQGGWVHHAPHVEEKQEQHQYPSGPETRITLPQLQHSMKGAYSSADDAFFHMDQDHDNLLDFSAFAEGLADFKPSVDAANAKWAFDGIDSDRDKEVSLQEFKAVLGETSSHAVQKAPHSSSSSGMLEAEVQYREKARKWAGSMKRACEQMGLREGNALQLHIFKYASKPFEPLLSDAVLEALFHQMDCDGDNQISPAECYVSMDTFKKKLSTVKSVRNMFCDSDDNNDHKLSAEEFDHFGKLLDSHCGGAKYGAFFLDNLDQNHDGFADLGDIEVLGKGVSSESVLSDEDLQQYDGVPAIVHGKASIEVETSSSASASEVGNAFVTALGKEIGLTINLAGEQALPSSNGMKIFVVLYTSRSTNGKDTLEKLRADAGDIENEVEAAIIAAVGGTGGKATVWSESSFSFYGPKAGKLPGGQKISQAWGRKLGNPADNGSPPITGA
mmetsp:Transcript_16816/g.29553  ORF Transcript_16816/g.29553 Transcript_16816/m.29553 type:complete len:866 (+) Transcript_16816:85-2682(+)|eukprot:CAMPEP_0197655204 /NCGR_PEP_ID=MMETSP1338-20131121/39313_1 /TAXON_ID=43686 ORGANISM="Pelagodinium beii, Strain RCC1491" /NCGR_SAMPLE_ID=MMETSP1338 /ASSEMBLY_ACC=CAM_ASM_000754 /LENGTH=865 /DNA_ID=CAMNT_0043230805 /DNA_START=66 /DNA_END=2663 /DNA_ORIENTATION=-